MNRYERYGRLKTGIGGNYEKRDYEYNMGATIQEKWRISPNAGFHRRIMGEMLFAIQLSERLDGRYDELVEAALSHLEKAMAENGVLTSGACRAAEEILLPMQAAAKEYEVICAGHAHIDMNWKWGWQETVAATLSTFRTMLNLMNEYPAFTFSQSQASVYHIVEEHDPEMMEEIRQRIREGRWEVTASAWVETDKNMPDTESLLRHISQTRAYLKDHWGVDPEQVKVDFSPDTFGHSAYVPEINRFGDVPYYYHCRGLEDNIVLYRYRAPSGSEVLVYKEPYWYNSGAHPDNGTGVFDLEKSCGGLKTSLIVYGVGNHGGGPTRRDIELLLDMQQWPIFPALRFGTMHEYFAIAETVRDKVPVIDHELNGIFTGCYTTQSRIKLANRRAEAGILQAQTAAALSHGALGTAYPTTLVSKAWQETLFIHFHDILTGSCVPESRDHALGKLATALGYAQTATAKAYEHMSRQVDTTAFPKDEDVALTQSEGAGVGYGLSNYAGVPNPDRGAGKVRIYTVFNPTAQPRREVVEMTLWDYPGDLARLQVIDQEGRDVPFQRMDSDHQRYWDHRYFRVAALVEVPAYGHADYAVVEKPRNHYPTFRRLVDRIEKPHGPVVLENEKLVARFDTGSGQLQSLVNKENGCELLAAPAGLHLVRTEDSSMSAWLIGRYFGMEPVTDTFKVDLARGPVRQSVTFHQRVMHSTVKMTVSLDQGAEALRYSMEIDWHETAKAQPWVPLLSFRVPLKDAAARLVRDVPAGFAVTDAQDMDVPALSCVWPEQGGVLLGTDCKYGFRLSENVLSATLINTAGAPDLYPERNEHSIKLFLGLHDGQRAMAKEHVRSWSTPMTAVPTAWHPGKLPACASLMDVQAQHTVVSSVSVEDSALTLRLYEVDGKPETVTIRAPFQIGQAVLTDMKGRVLGEAAYQGDCCTLTVEPLRLVQVKIRQ